MIEEKKIENNFKFGVYLKTDKMYEKIFSADLYNPVVRYSVDIRESIPKIIRQLQLVLSENSNNLSFDNTSKHYSYNTLSFYKKIYKINKLNPEKLTVPVQENKEIVTAKSKFQGIGTEFKFGLYINSSPIVERNFYVENYNPETRFSNEFIELIDDIIKYLELYLKKSDFNHMWNDYDLINIYELNIQQVRELSREKRDELLSKKSMLSFVEKTRMEYSKSYEYTV